MSIRSCPTAVSGLSRCVIERPNGPDTNVVITDTTIVADTTIVDNDTTIVADTTFSGDTTIVVDTTVTIVTPDPVFSVLFPNGDAAVGQTINFNLNLPGIRSIRALRWTRLAWSAPASG